MTTMNGPRRGCSGEKIRRNVTDLVGYLWGMNWTLRGGVLLYTPYLGRVTRGRSSVGT